MTDSLIRLPIPDAPTGAAHEEGPNPVLIVGAVLAIMAFGAQFEDVFLIPSRRREMRVWLVLGLALLVCLYVPWTEDFPMGSGMTGHRAIGYGFIFEPPEGSGWGTSVDFPRWAIGALLAAVVSFVLVWTSRDRPGAPAAPQDK